MGGFLVADSVVDVISTIVVWLVVVDGVEVDDVGDVCVVVAVLVPHLGFATS